MTVSTNTKTQEKPYFRFFPSMNQGSASKFSRYIPKKFTFAVGVFGLIARFAFLKFPVLKDYFFKNPQPKPIEKTPLPQPTQPEIQQPIQPVVMEESKNPPPITNKKAARTWAERRGQLLTKI